MLRPKKRDASANQPTIQSHFAPVSVTVVMSKDTFKPGVAQTVTSGAPLRFFESPGFLTLNGKILRKLNVSLSGESISRLVLDAANRMRESLKKDLKGKLVYIITDGATRQLRSFLGINVQYYCEREKKVVVKTLACADTERKCTSADISAILNITMHKFERAAENLLALIIDNASNMTKTVELLNQNDAPVTVSPDEIPSDDDDENDDDNEFAGANLVHIHHMSCVVHMLQLAIKDRLKQPHCNPLLTKTRHVVAKLPSPNVLTLLEKRAKKRPVLDVVTRWGSTYLMIKHLLELREGIKELCVLAPELLILSTMWFSLEELQSVLEVPYILTVKLQAENITSGVFMKEWCSLKRTMCRKETKLAAEIFKSTEKRESSLYQSKLFLAGVFVDARYRIPLTEEQMEVAKTGLMEVALKWYHCSSYASSSSIDDSVVESIQVDDTITEPNSSSPSDEGDLSGRLPRSSLSNDSDSFSQVAEKVNQNIEKMI